jgi:endonuclease/exonuclease/phosphatase (EEP) superfamily protein YafD
MHLARMPDLASPPEAAAPASRGATRRRRNPLVPSFCLAYAVGVLAFFLVIRYAGDHWWPATILLYAPRWPWLLPLFVLLPLTLHRRDKKWIWLTCFAGIFALGPLMGLAIPWRRLVQATTGEMTGEKLRVLVCNVHRAELNPPALDAYIRQMQPQVVLLQDYSPRDAGPAFSGPGWRHYQLGEIFIATRFPLKKVHDLHLERIPGPDDGDVSHRTGSAVCFDLETASGPLHVVGLHLASPHPALRTLARNRIKAAMRLEANSTRRWRESQHISDWLATQTGPLIIAGDFNTPADSAIYRQFWWKYPDAFPTAGFGFGYTHLSWLSEMRIDHLLTSQGITCTGFQTGPDCGTPHRPMVADLVIQSPR